MKTLEGTRLHSSHLRKDLKSVKKHKSHLKKKYNHPVCGADILIKLQLDVTFGKPSHFVCYASIIVNDKLHTSIVTIKSFQPGAVFVECIVRCKQLSIKLLDEEIPASSSVGPSDELTGRITADFRKL